MSMSMMEIDQALRQLRLSGMRTTLETRIIESQVSNLTFVETLSAILQDELDAREAAAAVAAASPAGAGS